MVCTIYMLTNTVNNKIYIGQTWRSFKKRMGRNGGSYEGCTILYNAIKKYGVDKFEYKTLYQCDNQKEADALEEYYIKRYNSKNRNIGYNLRDGGSTGKHSEETKEKISKTLKVKIWSEEAIANRKKALYARKGEKRIPHTNEWKENNSKMMIERHKTKGHPMQGKHHSEEAKLKISKTNTGKKYYKRKSATSRMLSKEIEAAVIKAYQDGMEIREIKATITSHPYRILERNNIPLKGRSNIWLGKTHTEETKKKQSIARTKYWEKNNKNEVKS